MATNARTLDVEAFTQEVTERHLDVKGPIAGYLYAGYQGTHGWEVIRCANNPWYLLTGRYVLTQDNAAGGQLRQVYTFPAGQANRLICMYGQGSASAGATLECALYDEDGALLAMWSTIAAGVSRSFRLPSIGAVATSTANCTNTMEFIVGPGTQLYVTSSAAAQTETLTVGYVFLSQGSTHPTVTTTGSAGTPNLGANTISAANRTLLVAMP